MGILAPSADERVCDVQIGPDTLTVALMDGRSISVPLAWFPRLLDATPEQRAGAGRRQLRHPLARLRRGS